MALLDIKEIHGVNLPYSRFLSCEFNKNEVVVFFQRSVSGDYNPLVTESILLSEEQSKSLADKMTKLVYNELKEAGVITGTDC